MKELFSKEQIALQSEWANKLYELLPNNFSIIEILSIFSLLFLRVTATFLSHEESNIDKKTKFKLLHMFIEKTLFVINIAKEQIDEEEKENRK